MSKQPDALRLADELATVIKWSDSQHWETLSRAEDELRRLHAEVERLRKLVPDVEFAREAIYGKAEGREA